MSKTVTFLVNSTPERPALGYGDYVVVESDEALLFGSHASTCPNPYRLNDHWVSSTLETDLRLDSRG